MAQRLLGHPGHEGRLRQSCQLAHPAYGASGENPATRYFHRRIEMKRLATLTIAASALAAASAYADQTAVAPAPGAASNAPSDSQQTLRVMRAGSRPSARGP